MDIYTAIQIRRLSLTFLRGMATQVSKQLHNFYELIKILIYFSCNKPFSTFLFIGCANIHLNNTFRQQYSISNFTVGFYNFQPYTT